MSYTDYYLYVHTSILLSAVNNFLISDQKTRHSYDIKFLQELQVKFLNPETLAGKKKKENQQCNAIKKDHTVKVNPYNNIAEN